MLAVRRGRQCLTAEYETLFEVGGFPVEPFARDESIQAFEAYRRFGKGYHPAAPSFADCAAHALAKSLDVPLLFKGSDFARTDVRRAL